MIVVIDYKAGNLTSMRLAFEHIGHLVTITDKPDVILAAERVVFPGVGAAAAAMENLKRDFPKLTFDFNLNVVFITLQ